MKIIILGGAGFLGVSLAQLLKSNGKEVVVVDSKSRLKKNKQYLNNIVSLPMDFPEIDLSFLNQLFDQGDQLVHMACTTNPNKSMKNIKFDASSNIIPSIEIFSLAVKNKLDKIVFTSSGGTVYGNCQSKIIKENEDKNPISAYGVSKLAIENYLNVITMGSETNGVSLRVGNPFGSYQLKGTTIGAIAAFMNFTQNNQQINIYGDGSIVRDYIYIDDVSNAFLYSLNHKNLHGTFNIGSGIGFSINEILALIKEILNIDQKIAFHKSRQFDVPRIILDASKFKQKTNWKPKITVKNGIELIWKDLQNELVMN